VHDLSSVGKSAILSIDSRGHVSLLNKSDVNMDRKKDTKSALSRLRDKRQKKSSNKSKNVGQLKVREGMMPLADKLFQMGESSDAAYMSRCVGMLSEAEHFGRLR